MKLINNDTGEASTIADAFDCNGVLAVLPAEPGGPGWVLADSSDCSVEGGPVPTLTEAAVAARFPLDGEGRFFGGDDEFNFCIEGLHRKLGR